MAESFGHDLDRNAGRDEKCGVGVAKIVESDPGETRAGDAAVEQLADGLGVEWLAGLVGEDWIVGSGSEAAVELPLSPRVESCLGRRVEVDASSAGLSLGEANSVDRPATTCLDRLIERRWSCWFQSDQRSPAISPRRMPVDAARCNAG